MNVKTDFFVKLSEAGQKPSDINTAVVALLKADRITLDEAMTILRPARAIGATLDALEKWGDTNIAADAPAKPALPPGMVVADVVSADEGVYSGPVNEATLTDANRRYIANNLGKFSARWGQVFNAKVRFAVTAGDAMVGEQSPITVDGFDLSTI